MKISFLLTGEGSSDLRLQSHIESVLIAEGFSEVDGETPDLGLLPKVGRTVKEKLEALIKYYPDVDIIFVHRDADGAGTQAREDEIFLGAEGVLGKNRVIPVVPSRMLETWLLADVNAIRAVAGARRGEGKLDCVPAARLLESIADAKGRLLEALCEASEAEGGRLTKFKKRFNEMRARLAMDLDPEGPVNDLPSYRAFRQRIRELSQASLQRHDDKIP